MYTEQKFIVTAGYDHVDDYDVITVGKECVKDNIGYIDVVKTIYGEEARDLYIKLTRPESKPELTIASKIKETLSILALVYLVALFLLIDIKLILAIFN